MPNMSPKKNPMPSQDPLVRAHNFMEVTTGYTEEVAIDEALRCLNCKHMPCVSGCPVNIHIPEFIRKIKEGDFEGAYQIISLSSSLPAVCGRVCPQETQCESKCVRGIKGEPVGIGRLERFVADWHNAHSEKAPEPVPSNGHKVAIVGSGPSGLTCAGDLAKKGYKVSVFEALHTTGGVLVYGIPEFRLPKAIVQKEVDNLVAMGVDIETNMVIGKTLTIDELFGMGYEAVFVGSGAGLPNFMGIPGESLKGVYSANEFLTRSNLMKAYKDDPVTPISKGGNVAGVGGGKLKILLDLEAGAVSVAGAHEEAPGVFLRNPEGDQRGTAPIHIVLPSAPKLPIPVLGKALIAGRFQLLPQPGLGMVNAVGRVQKRAQIIDPIFHFGSSFALFRSIPAFFLFYTRTAPPSTGEI